MVRAGRHVFCLAIVTALGVSAYAAAGSAAAQALPVMGRALPMSTPNPSPTQNQLLGVSAESATDAWAVGLYFNSVNVAQTLILRWNGTAWSQVPSPDPEPNGDWLGSVSALSPTDAWAVGVGRNSAGVDQTLILHWNGTAWSQVSSPDPSSTGNELTGIDAISGSRAWAVGNYGSHTLILRWNGHAWSQVPSPNPGIGGDVLTSVSAASRTDAWAVGTYLHGAGATDASLTLHWNGIAWSRVKSPTSRAGFAQLTSASTISRTDASAVGNGRSNNFSINTNLALHGTAPSGSK